MGILRWLPAGLGPGEEAVRGSVAPAIREFPGTAAASRPPEVARNCRRSIEELMADESWQQVLGQNPHALHLGKHSTANRHPSSRGIIRRNEPQTSTENRFSKSFLR